MCESGGTDVGMWEKRVLIPKRLNRSIANDSLESTSDKLTGPLPSQTLIVR